MAVRAHEFAHSDFGKEASPAQQAHDSIKTRGVHRALPKYVRRGWPDICLIKQGVFNGTEVKSEIGKLSPEQDKMTLDIIRNGGVTSWREAAYGIMISQ